MAGKKGMRWGNRGSTVKTIPLEERVDRTLELIKQYPGMMTVYQLANRIGIRDSAMESVLDTIEDKRRILLIIDPVTGTVDIFTDSGYRDWQA